MKQDRGLQKQEEFTLLILAGSFLIGGLCGCFWAKTAPAASWIPAFFQEITGGTVPQPDPMGELWNLLRWPLLALLLSRLPLRKLTIPILFLARGCLLSWSIAALVDDRGTAGLACAGILLGPTCLLTVPVLFSLGIAGLRPRERCKFFANAVWPTVVLCLLPLAACFFLERHMVPFLLNRCLSLFLRSRGTDACFFTDFFV